ncbi:hypothetical protein ACU3L3_07455 [Priestia endophytica]
MAIKVTCKETTFFCERVIIDESHLRVPETIVFEQRQNIGQEGRIPINSNTSFQITYVNESMKDIEKEAWDNIKKATNKEVSYTNPNNFPMTDLQIIEPEEDR